MHLENSPKKETRWADQRGRKWRMSDKNVRRDVQVNDFVYEPHPPGNPRAKVSVQALTLAFDRMEEQYLGGYLLDLNTKALKLVAESLRDGYLLKCPHNSPAFLDFAEKVKEEELKGAGIPPKYRAQLSRQREVSRDHLSWNFKMGKANTSFHTACWWFRHFRHLETKRTWDSAGHQKSISHYAT